MSLAFAIAIYIICWWIVLFAILPIGLKTQEEAGRIEPGTPESAPARPNLLWKLIATTIVAGFLFAGVYAVLVLEAVDLDAVPFLPRFETPTQVR